MEKKITTALSYFDSISIEDWNNREEKKPVSVELSSVIEDYVPYGVSYPVVCTISSTKSEKPIYDLIVESWMAACEVASHYNLKIIYTIKETTYVVFPDSDPNMMIDIMPEPKFYKNINWAYPTNVKSFLDFYDNVYVIMFMKPKTVGPHRMPKITKVYMEHATAMNLFVKSVKEYEDKIEMEKNKSALSKEKFYAFLGKSCTLTDKEINNIDKDYLHISDEMLVKSATHIWQILCGIIKYMKGTGVKELSDEFGYVIDRCASHNLWNFEIIDNIIEGLQLVALDRPANKQLRVLLRYNTLKNRK